MRAPNRVTAAYIETNLRLSAHDLIFASASFRQLLIALPDAVARLFPAGPVTTTVHASHGWVILTDDADATIPILHACAGALARINVCAPVAAADLAAFSPAHASHQPTDGWTAIPPSHIDLSSGFIDLKTKRGRQFLCYLGSFMLLLWRTDDLSDALSARPTDVHKYFLYLLWRDGYKAVPALSVAKTAVFREVRQARAMDALRREVSGLARVAGENAADVRALAQTVEQEMCEIGAKVDERLWKVEDGLYEVNDRLAREVQSIDGVIERLDIVVDDRMRGLAARIQNGEDAREGFEERLQGVGQRLDAEVNMREVLGSRIGSEEDARWELAERLDMEEDSRKALDSRLDSELQIRDTTVENLSARLDTEEASRASLDTTVHALSARLDTEVHSLGDRVTVLGDSVGVLRDSMLSSAAQAEANSNQRHQDMMSFMQSLMAQRSTEPAPPIPTARLIPGLTFLLRLRRYDARVSAVQEAQGAALKVAGKKIPGSPVFKTIFTEQANYEVTEAVMQEVFINSERFVLAVHGYSGHGKTHTVMGTDGVLDAILRRLVARGGLKVTVREILHEDVVVGEFLLREGDAIPGTIEQIKVVLHTAGTPANAQSSQRHTVVTVGSESEPGVLYGMVVDVAGEETSRNRALLPPQMVQTSNVICSDNAAFRKLLRECGIGGVSPVTKRASKLNMRLVDFGGRVVLIVVADSADLEVLKKAVTS